MSGQPKPNASPAERIRAIDARIRARHAELGIDDAAKPEFGMAPTPVLDTPESMEMRALIQHLDAAYRAFRYPPADLALAPSPATRLPLIGRLWARVRENVHVLPLFYVHRTATRQVAVNRALIGVLNLLTLRIQRQRAELAGLRERGARE